MTNLTLEDAIRAKRLLLKSKIFAEQGDYKTASLYLAEAARLTEMLLQVPEFAEKYEASFR
jgi:hypothetical protein